jgi:hypothetical protein
MKKVYIQPSFRSSIPQLEVDMLQASTLDPTKDNQSVIPDDEEYDGEFGSKSRGAWSEDGLW